ncbi:MAG: ATP-dependent helicase [Candidatus Nanoarchaeia archaeon]
MPDLITKKEEPDHPTQVEALLHPFVKKWFFNKFESFSLPQQYALREVHSRQNILVSAPTGATKTLTAFLSILNELVDSSEKGLLKDKIYAIYISPLKALNEDIKINLQEPLKEIEEIAGKDLGIRVAVRTGDTTQYEKQKMLKNPPHILITTPESLAILLASKKFSEHLKDVEWGIIDEIHSLAENKRGVQLSIMLEQLSYLASHMCRVGLSATVAPIEEIARYLVGPNRPCKIVDVQFLKQLDLKVLSPVPNLIETTFKKSHEALYRLMHDLIQSHKTTIIFTNTRAGTERVVHNLKEIYPRHYGENIGAHHGSLSKSVRHSVEERLRKGEMKVVSCSTSLELGIDIGFVDLVICLGSPKSVARALQRIGRSGHQLKSITKGRIIVMDRDDLIECSVLLKSAMEKKVDRIHIPTNALDVLAQAVVGFAHQQVWNIKELYDTIKQSYCYQDLKRDDLEQILDYLAGSFARLEDRYIYAKIWKKDGHIGKRGKLSRVIYMTNIGTIPDASFIQVKIGNEVIGKLDEQFLEKLKRNDIFVLGGNTYQFQYARGMTAQVKAAIHRTPTVPSWISEMLPLSFDLAMEIGRFRRYMLERFQEGMKKKDMIDFINHYLYVGDNAAEAIYKYFYEHYKYCKIFPSDKTILIEHFKDGETSKVIFHTLYGRRVNDCLSRALAFVVFKTEKKDVELGISDNGFYISTPKKMNIVRAFEMLKADKMELVLDHAIDKSEVLRRRFRHCAGRALMILRNYKGKRKRVGRQQVSSMILIKALREIDPNFSILKEAKREVLEDLMDIKNTKEIIQQVNDKTIRIEEINTKIPSPFAFNLALQGVMDILKMEDRLAFLKRMHEQVLVKISLDEGKKAKT